jgi:hypothetical protein
LIEVVQHQYGSVATAIEQQRDNLSPWAIGSAIDSGFSLLILGEENVSTQVDSGLITTDLAIPAALIWIHSQMHLAQEYGHFDSNQDTKPMTQC